MATPELNKHEVKLGFIGLGIMGTRLTRRLHAAGWNVHAWNRSAGPAEELRRSGVPIVASLVELVRDSNVILSSLSNDAAVHSVYSDSGGVFASAKPGTVLLEMSTISPQLSRLLHHEASSLGLRLLDLAVSGSAPAVEAGSVTLLAGGEQSTFDECAPLYASFAKQWFLLGAGSSGVQMKLVVNLLLAIGMQALAEAISLGEHLQLDKSVLFDVLSKTAVIPPALLGKLQKIQAADYSPQFPLRLMSKDMDLIMETARSVGADLPASCAAKSVLNANLEANGDSDLSAIVPSVLQGTTAQSSLQRVADADSVCTG
jgi:3-hydroxyisobutyrate dehydrogenase-like beta-hydroxyacid dehydrogenase